MHGSEETYIYSLACALGDARHVAVGSASPHPSAAAWLAHFLSGKRMRVSMLGSADAFFTDGGREFFDCAAQGRIDAFFLGGGQIDGQGNINLMGTGRYPDLDVRWGGTYGAPYLYSLVKRVVLFHDNHKARVMVPRVDFITAAGGNEPNVYRPGGPVALVTNLGVFSFDAGRRRFSLRSVHSGHTEQEIQEATGFTYDVPITPVPLTPSPEPRARELLLSKVVPLIAPTYPQFAARLLEAA